MAAVLAALASPTYRVITSLAYHTALRPGEIAVLHRCHLHLPTRQHTPGTLTILLPDAKSRLGNRTIPLDPAQADQLRHWLHLIEPDPTRPLFARQINGWRTALNRAARATGHTITTVHCRAAGINAWWHNGLPATEIAARAGLTLSALLRYYPNPAND
jgi:integrase